MEKESWTVIAELENENAALKQVVQDHEIKIDLYKHHLIDRNIEIDKLKQLIGELAIGLKEIQYLAPGNGKFIKQKSQSLLNQIAAAKASLQIER
jgi:hypothetical protein